MVYLEDMFPGQVSMGICNCRDIAGGSSWSHHAECRAYDEGFAVFTGQTIGIRTLELLGPHGARLGIDHMILNHDPGASDRGDPRVYSARSPQGRTYTGSHPHKNHNHIGLTRNAGRLLTYATLVDVLGDPSDQTKETEDMLPLQFGHGYPVQPDGSKLAGDHSHRIEDVRALQDLLNLAYGTGLKLDGLYGPATATAVENHIGRYTGYSYGQQGFWVGGNQWGNLIRDVALTTRATAPDVSGLVTKDEFDAHGGHVRSTGTPR